MENNNIEYSSYSILLDKKIEELQKIKMEIEDAISKLNNNDMYEIMHRRYILYESFTEISENIHRSLRQTFRIHNKAIEKMKETENLN